MCRNFINDSELDLHGIVEAWIATNHLVLTLKFQNIE